MSNYTEEMTLEITSVYVQNPTRETVEALAVQFEKTPRSIIAKLSREGVYIPQVPVRKSDGVTKETLVRHIEEVTGVSLPSLSKASKNDLEALVLTFNNNA